MLRFIPGYWIVSYKHPKKHKLIYKEFETKELALKAPHEIVSNNQVFIQYGFHGCTKL